MYTLGKMEQDTLAMSQPPRTLTVLGLLAVTALTFSYLGSYAVTNALVANEVMRPWSDGQDPRPRWLVTGFCVLMLVFIAVGGFFRVLSRRELKQIAAMDEAEDVAF